MSFFRRDNFKVAPAVVVDNSTPVTLDDYVKQCTFDTTDGEAQVPVGYDGQLFGAYAFRTTPSVIELIPAGTDRFQGGTTVWSMFELDLYAFVFDSQAGAAGEWLTCN